ncbi:MAG: hypothetical protein Q8L14_09530 [Myxococcales bacterium]|nr:hypothetical protein [Myxococcales bacterium]
MRPAVAIVFVLCGCGRSDVVDDAPPIAAPAPITTCASTCTTSPASIDTPMQTTDDGKPLHWATCAGCVRVSFDATLSPSEALTLLAAVKDWQRAAGERLCLKLDQKSSAGLISSEEQRIHVARASTQSPAVPVTTVTFDAKTARLKQALVEFGDSVPLDRQLVAGLGRALGLATGQDMVSAVTSRPEGLTTPGRADLASLRAMYGTTPWCTGR